MKMRNWIPTRMMMCVSVESVSLVIQTLVENAADRIPVSGIEVMYLIFFLILPVGVLFINY